MASSKNTENPRLTNISDSDFASLIKQTQGRIMGTDSSALKDINAFRSLSIISDPVAVGFKIFFNFSSNYGLFGQESKNGSDTSNSAIDYLNRIGQTARASLLKKFILHLQDMNMNMAFMFQTIEGLDVIRQHKPWEMYKADEAKIKLGLLETVDFKVQSLMSMYNNIWYDTVRGVEVLPANLRRFDCSIYIYAIGAYQIHTNNVNSDDKTVSYNTADFQNRLNNEAIRSIPNVLINPDGSMASMQLTNTDGLYVTSPDLFNHVVYDLCECEFLPWESQDGFHKPSNSEYPFITNDITFSFRFCHPGYRFFNELSDIRVSDSLLFQVATANSSGGALSIIDKFKDWKSNLFGDSWLGNVAESMFDKATSNLMNKAEAIIDKYGSVEKLKQVGTDLLHQAVESVADRIGDYAASKINSLFLGNVYDYTSVSSLTDALTADNMVGALSNEFLGKSAASLKSIKKLKSPGPNVYTKM